MTPRPQSTNRFTWSSGALINHPENPTLSLPCRACSRVASTKSNWSGLCWKWKPPLRTRMSGAYYSDQFHHPREVLQGRDDVEHQLVIWPLSGVEHIDLLVQQAQELFEISMLGVACGDRVGHFSLLLEQGHCMQVNIGPPVCLGEINRHIASLRLSPPGKLSRSARGALLTQIKMR